MTPPKKDPRFRPPNPRQAAKNYAALAALMQSEGPAFGVRVIDPNAPPESGLDRARTAYAAEPADPRSYPMPGPINWLANMTAADLKNAPKGVRNWITSMAKAVARDPVTAMMPLPKGGLVAKEAARAAKLRKYSAARAAYDSERMQNVNRFLAEKRTPFALGLEPPPLRSTPVKQYKVQREGFGPRVDVVDEVVSPPEMVTLEQARVAGVMGPEAYPPPPYRFTRNGPRVEFFDQ